MFNLFKREIKTPKIEIGSKWTLSDDWDNPFRGTKDCVIILNVKNGWVLYKLYNMHRSMRVKEFLNIYREIPDPDNLPDIESD